MSCRNRSTRPASAPVGGKSVGWPPPAVTSFTSTSSGTGRRRPPGATAARRSSSVGGAWLALASCRSLKASIKSCIAWLGMPASALAWAAHLIRRGWLFGSRIRSRRFGRLLPAITLATPNDRVAGTPPPRTTGPDDPTAARLDLARHVISTHVRPGCGHCEPLGTGRLPNPGRPVAAPSPTRRLDRHRRSPCEATTEVEPYPRGQRRSGVSCSPERQPAPRHPRAAHAEAATP
jgi:hypothetical protein